MKIRLSFKTPDVVDDAVAEEVFGLTYRFLLDNDVEEVDDLSSELREELEEKSTVLRDELSSVLGHWIQYGEQITVELDTTTKVGTVVPVGA